MTGDPDPVLADPAQERLARATELPPAEFSRSTLILTYIAALLGLVLAAAVVWYVIAQLR
jgi:hypothetical protein